MPFRADNGSVRVDIAPGCGAGAICFIVHSLAPSQMVYCFLYIYFVSAIIKYGDVGELSI